MKRWRCALTGHRQTLHPYQTDPAWSRCECNRVTTPRAPNDDWTSMASEAWKAAEEKTIAQMYRCGSCAHFERAVLTMSDPPTGDCHRFPRWETVEETHSCSEWEARA